MALINCPECNKQISAAAEACPNCGHPVKKVVTQNATIVDTTPESQESFPKWVIVPLVLIGVFIIFGLIYMLQNNEQADQQNINVNIDTAGQTTKPELDKTVGTQTQTTPDVNTIPLDNSTEIPQTNNDQTIGADTKTQVIDEKSEKGKLQLEAKVSDPKGNVKPVNAEKFYLLDKELETILREANLQPIQNQNLVNSFGLSVLNPGKYKEFNEKALNAINDHIKYDSLTDSNGKASIENIEPKNYYLFGIHKVGNGFAVWSSPVTINKGVNNLNIQPQRTTEITQ